MQEYENQLEHLGVTGVKRRRRSPYKDGGSQEPPKVKGVSVGVKQRGGKRLENETLYNKIKFQDMDINELVKSTGSAGTYNDNAQMLETLDAYEQTLLNELNSFPSDGDRKNSTGAMADKRRESTGSNRFNQKINVQTVVQHQTLVPTIKLARKGQ